MTPPADPSQTPPLRPPRHTLWPALFRLPEPSALPLQARLRAAVVREILGGRLPPGTALPASRELARQLSLSRNTVTAAFAQLVEEGFVEARPRLGLFVAAGARLSVAEPAAAPPSCAEPVDDGNARGPDWPARVLRRLADHAPLAKPERWLQDYPYAFVYGGHDPALFPTEDFRECCAHSLARAQLAHWAPDFESDDVPDLLEQIRQRLLPRRGVFAQADEIVVTVGAQQAFHLLAEALFDRRTRLGFEEPGYPHARNAFALRNPQWRPLPVDAQGLQVDALPALDYVFVTPSQQSPTTVPLSLPRRERLLQHAQQHDIVVIEDDYECENLYAGRPMPALKSLDRTARVVYVGSLAKSLAPAVRLGFIVAPPALAAELRRLRHAMVRHPSTFLQHAYALFLSLGHHESHARRVNLVLAQRMTQAAVALRRHLPGCRFELPQGGASIWVQAPPAIDGAALALAARRHGVLIEAGEDFFLHPPRPCPFFRLRLSSIATERIAPGIQALGRAAAELAAGRRGKA